MGLCERSHYVQGTLVIASLTAEVRNSGKSEIRGADFMWMELCLEITQMPENGKTVRVTI